MELKHCEVCNQMTNHGCLKCSKSEVLKEIIILTKQVLTETFHYPTTKDATEHLRELKKMIKEIP